MENVFVSFHNSSFQSVQRPVVVFSLTAPVLRKCDVLRGGVVGSEEKDQQVVSHSWLGRIKEVSVCARSCQTRPRHNRLF